MVKHDIQKPEISIIVPVYNIEKYLSICLTSIKNQSFKNWECWVVNDGSQDKSAEICEKFSNEDTRFKVIHKLNGGVSNARNAALKKAEGELIAFIDSDDWIDENYLQELYRLLKTYNADVAQCGYIKEFTSFKRIKNFSNDIIVTEFEEILRELTFNRKVQSYLWNKLYRREVIDCLFPEGKVYEDYFVMTHWAKNIKKMVTSPLPLYHYRMRRSSINLNTKVSTQIDFMEAIKIRCEESGKLLPTLFSDEDKRVFVYKNLVERAKIIARKVNDPLERKDGILIIQKELEKIPIPEKKVLGNKLWKRSNLILKDPSSFIKKMRMAQAFDIHDKYCSTKMFP